MQIRKNCASKPFDDDKMKAIKIAVLLNLDRRFQDRPTVKLHHIFDPETKGLLPREEVTRLLEYSVKAATERNFIQLNTKYVTSNEPTTEDEDAVQQNKRRMRMELLSDLRSVAPALEDSQVFLYFTQRCNRIN